MMELVISSETLGPTSQTTVSRQIKLYYDRRSVGQSVSVSGTHLGPVIDFLSFFL
jgi:hypothetical protein